LADQLDLGSQPVETEEIKRHLEALGCDTLQGYHLGRPQPASRIAEVAEPQQPRRAAG